jgi:hypothetical protein
MTRKLKGRDEKRPGYNPGTLGKCSVRSFQAEKLYKSIAFSGGLMILLFSLHKFHEGRWKSY